MQDPSLSLAELPLLNLGFIVNRNYSCSIETWTCLSAKIQIVLSAPCGAGLIQYHIQSDTVHLHCIIPINSNCPNGALGSTEIGFHLCSISPAGASRFLDLVKAWDNPGMLGQLVRNMSVGDDPTL